MTFLFLLSNVLNPSRYDSLQRPFLDVCGKGINDFIITKYLRMTLNLRFPINIKFDEFWKRVSDKQ